MMKPYISFILALLVHLQGCTAKEIQQAVPNTKLTLAAAEEIKPGKTTMEEIRKVFGAPSRELNLNELDSRQESGIVWSYDDGGQPNRLSLFFEDGSHTVLSLVWSVREGEPEGNLKHALSRYKGTNWVSESEPQTNPHVIPKKCHFINKTMGISIEFDRVRNEVMTISWSDPRRIPANTKPEKKEAVSCIGGNCFKYDPSRLTWKSPPCELPK